MWSLTLGRTVVSAHIKATDPEQALTSAHEICEDMGVAHSTIQVKKEAETRARDPLLFRAFVSSHAMIRLVRRRNSVEGIGELSGRRPC